jgi:cytochrome P450
MHGVLMAMRAHRLPVETPSPGLPPGPTAWPIVQLLRYARRPYGVMEDAAHEFGTCYTVRGPGLPPMVVFSDPDAIKDIFTADPDALHGGEAQGPFLGPLIGWNSLLLLDGARHRRERRLLMPPFHGERMQVYGRVIREIADRAIDRWPIGRPFPVHAEMQAITLDVILRAVFGLDEERALARVRETILRALRLFEGPTAPFLAIPLLQRELGGLSPWGRFVRCKHELRRTLHEEIVRRRTHGTGDRSDVLSMLVDARDEDDAPMTDDELFDEMFTILGAGHETTASSLAWTFCHVLPRPDVLDAIATEHARVVGDGPVEPEHLPRLEYLDAVIKETARITPVATQTTRHLMVPMRIGERDLPAGINVSAAIYATHHRADLWPDPERFDPDRFLGTRPEPYTFFPFGGGERRCLGAAFASFEMKVVLAQVLSRTRLRLAPGYRMRPLLRAITVAPAKGVPVIRDR